MIPPKEINVIDKHNGFTAITKSPTYKKVFDENGKFLKWEKVWQERDTLWRSSALLKGETIGVLQDYDENSFYQNNNDVTIAFYKVKGYCNRIVLWFNNKTGERIG